MHFFDEAAIRQRNAENRRHRRAMIARITPHYVKTREPVQPPRPRGVRLGPRGLMR